MEQIKINCSMCYGTKMKSKIFLLEVNIIYHQNYGLKILNFHTYKRCNLCLDKFCEEHIVVAERNCNYYKIHRKLYQNYNFM